MKNNGLFFTRNDCRQAAARENMKLKAEIHQTQHKMESLLNQFDQVTDPPLIDNRIKEDRDTTLEEILEIVKGPDFPTGAVRRRPVLRCLSVKHSRVCCRQTVPSNRR